MYPLLSCFKSLRSPVVMHIWWCHWSIIQISATLIIEPCTTFATCPLHSQASFCHRSIIKISANSIIKMQGKHFFPVLSFHYFSFNVNHCAFTHVSMPFDSRNTKLSNNSLTFYCLLFTDLIFEASIFAVFKPLSSFLLSFLFYLTST